jgi:biotin--protein ligase
VHFEYPLDDPPARDAIAKLSARPAEADVAAAERARTRWVARLLAALGLRLPADAAEEEDTVLLHPTHPSPIFALSHPRLPVLAQDLLSAPKIQAKLTDKDGDGNKVRTLRDGNDEIDITTVDAVPELTAELAARRRAKPIFPPAIEELSLSGEPAVPQPPNLHALTKTLFLPGATPYSPAWTPLFNFDTYWTELDAVRKRRGRRTGVLRADEMAAGKERAAIGDNLLYGETVTSTQTMLDRNPLLLNNLPAPLTFMASFQMAGRGRGTNLWLSPAGCLQFSILLGLPASMASKLVFIQYLAALAIAEAVDEDGRLGVRIKWPNDIYADAEGVADTTVGGGKKGRAKLAGILVNTNFVNGQWRVIVGCGVNVLNALPTSSVSQLHSLLTERAAHSSSSSTKPLPDPPTMENTFARIMAAFEEKWELFLEAKGFEPFMAEYHSRWLHSGQEVTLTTVEPHQRLRVVSITPDAGLLRCVPIAESSVSSHFERNYDDGYEDRVPAPSAYSSRPGPASATQYVDLQPDGNSFDLMAGMIKRKVM